ncbi:tRNA (adenosine(37)-N6)-threonylcarbamoyltransferase complex dimerization subunit type 1 TsaB [Flammeovirga kamogawensis]|uniref:tRNA (Adenosine(37)-N6)-threonylcarbamoyltransferase complex dimerization subunit type 1 TsaB n=1 Tax=Flammeovirga kamogawensis TaxID=373891 RepID=A0ABX8GPU9_9BACT|nr:tRNA (adenosine(37)-N6)-threonylcarbamoyltransferase complex dimerization subunit type 1 TsaB [Flammeovirga kamogawensis]MBB6463439.1 tRNA threonylcarbamoyladenosine biosynthesis protein TsaB [Flammeovirga kamogawensis]QWG05635.1 tRNA (adenosine(37)-N6)-threonylcarbamoyltransferase complex dimerization subunit type 1 TsaB [Flammeovirga kamogawensis]TRX67466.1 tRNA (adenosine(37)-N6)-threonylcarbamoyltransferase complex dimerization subunit type 1 TsaB [Flammeovirga kamogawensis]
MILSIDTSTTVCSVALHTLEGQLLSYYEQHIDKSHSEYLAVMIQNITENAGIKMSELSAVAVSEGPGSYTGLRIGASTAKGLCYTLDIPLLGVSTLKSMALQISYTTDTDDIICPMLDARRMEVYTALYTKSMEELLSPQPMIMDENSLSDVKERLVYFGNGAEKCQELLENRPNKLIKNIVPSAQFIGELAVERYKAEDFKDVAYWEPEYLKEFQATTPRKRL